MSYRIDEHPVLDFSATKKLVTFEFAGKQLQGYEGEPIITALRAEGVVKLREGMKHHTPFGPFCMQGRCCSCAMVVDGKPNVMTCVTPLKAGMKVTAQSEHDRGEVYRKLPERKIEVTPKGPVSAHPRYDLAVIGAGPAGLEAAIVARESGVERVVLFDDKEYLGGQLKLQTHTFFGNQSLGASLRGFEIAETMQQAIKQHNIEVKLGSTVIGLYPDGLIGYRDHQGLNFVAAQKIVCATGASEKFLSFEGNTIPGVMGAGGAQTFMNIYGVRPGKRAVIIGGGNIGVILAYQMTQANVEVACIVEASSKMGAYEVHVNKIKALGIPVLTRHTIVKACGKDHVTGATIAEVDDNFKVKPGTEKVFDADTICLAVGLSPLSELLWQIGCEFTMAPHLGEVVVFDKNRKTTHPDIYVAGDCAVIGEASIARLEGRIAGLSAAAALGKHHGEHEHKLAEAFALLDKIQSGSFGSKLGSGKAAVMGQHYQDAFKSQPYVQKLSPSDFVDKERRVIIKCNQDIPCNPCEASCKQHAITVGTELNQQPSLNSAACTGCGMCLGACPGRAIRLLQYNHDNMHSALTIAYEFLPLPNEGDEVEVLGDDYSSIAQGKVIKVRPARHKTSCAMVTFVVPKSAAFNARTFVLPQMNKQHTASTLAAAIDTNLETQPYVCRCEEVTHEEIVEAIHQGYTTVNELKRLKRIGMGQCRGLSCTAVIEGILARELGKTRQDIFNSKKERATVFRPPLKRVTLAEAAALNFTEEEIQGFQRVDREATVPLDVLNALPKDLAETDHNAQKDLDCKVVIIGGGITGVMTAWWLARLGLTDVVVFEKNFIGSGQTGACLGGVRTGFNTNNKIMRATKGLEIYRDAVKLIGRDVGWYQGGYVYLAFDQKQDQLFRNSFTAWKETGVPFEYVTDRSCYDRFVPGVDAEKVLSLVYFPEAGGANPFRALFGFSEDAKQQGVRFYNNHEAAHIDVDGGRVKGMTVLNKSDGSYRKVRCQHIVNCAGTSSVKIGKMIGIDLSDQIWIERHGAFITEKLPLWLKPLVVSYHPEYSGYWQQKRMESEVPEGEIVACYSSSYVVKGFNKQSNLYFLSRMAKAMLLCQPALADVGIVRNFAEHYVGRESGIPIIGESPVKGFWFNIAKKGHGFMCAPGDGYALALSIVQGKEHEWISECKIKEDHSQLETMK